MLLDPSGCGPTITTLSPTPISSPRVPSSQDRSPANEAAEEQRRGSGGGDGKVRTQFSNEILKLHKTKYIGKELHDDEMVENYLIFYPFSGLRCCDHFFLLLLNMIM